MSNHRRAQSVTGPSRKKPPRYSSGPEFRFIWPTAARKASPLWSWTEGACEKKYYGSDKLKPNIQPFTSFSETQVSPENPRPRHQGDPPGVRPNPPSKIRAAIRRGARGDPEWSSRRRKPKAFAANQVNCWRDKGSKGPKDSTLGYRQFSINV